MPSKYEPTLVQLVDDVHDAPKLKLPSVPTLALAFTVQLLGRTLAWTLVGMAMGLGQGIALRSKRLFIYGFLGGLLVGAAPNGILP